MGTWGGKQPNAGRKKGVPNKITTELKELIHKALHNVGGVKYLEKQANENPTSFNTLLAKTMPANVMHDGVIATAEIKLTPEQQKAGVDAIMRFAAKHGDTK